MLHFREYYEMGTDEYAKHTKKMTPGQQEATARGKADPKVVNNIVKRFKKARPKPGDHHYHLDNISDDEQAHRGEKDQARQILKKSGHFKEEKRT